MSDIEIDGDKLLALIEADIAECRRLGACESEWRLGSIDGFAICVRIARKDRVDLPPPPARILKKKPAATGGAA